MAVCKACGAELKGPFCSACGASAGSTPGQTQAVPPSPPAAAPYPPKRRTSPIVWVLIVLLSLFVLAGLVVGAGLAVVARKTGLGVAEILRDPHYTMARLGMSVDQDNQEISHSGDSITFRNRRTGKTATLRFEDLKNGNFRFLAGDENGKVARLEIGGGESKLPSWVPVYPGAESSGGLSASGDSGDKFAEGGTVVYTTPDPLSDVLAFYEAKGNDAGMTVRVSKRGVNSGVLNFRDDSRNRRLAVILARDSEHTNISLTYGDKE